ncbi:MAG: hypothetical protein HW402_507 [Dehalococcoidales bacterium]|nr:hypothetical protein [Dehalococcoidales bacterium]
MKVTRLYTGPDNESHFEDLDIPLYGKAGISRRSEPRKTVEILFTENYTSATAEWHNAPRRQFVITLKGEGEIEIGDGTKRRFNPGDILLAEDTTGRGHITRVLNNQPRTIASIPLD